ncbi:hypothetical protein I3842_03G022200 [Carya illinoinensis]|uniref:Ribosomal protein L34Ae n=1 Tax=Carya illinoinensis TaxID=32201 RepID=A0A922JT67_CARIL|nr:hypothetical protein I3842_03G022200 [Carya illinoinensis]KAG6719739.1 hypothetical protein I3842_03G022200 [Carya illinoinensis]
MDSVKRVFYIKIVLFAGLLLASVSRLWLPLVGYLNRVFLRHKKGASSGILSQENNHTNSKCIEPETESEVSYSESFRHGDSGYTNIASETSDYSSIGSQENVRIDSNDTEPEGEAEPGYSEVFSGEDVGHDVLDEIDSETPKFEFKFRFPTYEEISRFNVGSADSVSLESTAPSTSTSKYEFFSGKSFSHFLEEPEAVSFTVKELYIESNNHSIESIPNIEKDSMQQNSLKEAVHEKASETSEVPEKLGGRTSVEDTHSGGGQLEEPENDFSGEENVVDDKFLSEKDFIASDSDLEDSVCSSSLMSQFGASTSDLFLSEKDFEGTNEGVDVELTEEDLESEDRDSQNLDIGYEPEDFDGEDSDILEELQKLEESDMPKSDRQNSEKFYKDGFHGDRNSKDEDFGGNDEKQMDGKPNSKDSSEWDSEDSNELESLWEHQDLIEQLKMELKKVRATGLPTILEESECPKMIEDLKPWKIDEKFQHADRIGEVHKFYKSYRERMRKFDILNYQKMYAIGVLRSKDGRDHSFSSRKSSAPGITSLLSQTFRLSKHKKSELDPTMKFIRDLRCDLEVVYVGQLCLSWEILHWQYEKALELWDSDPYGLHPYNEVAGEFQQFQVLLQRFIENEPFQGPRVENYAKNRCVMRNLLQVPVIRGDKKKERRGKDDGANAITIDIVIEILEESMRIIWKFIRADKDASTVLILPCRRDSRGVDQLQDPADSRLLMEVRTDIQKKEKKLRDMLKSGNCILKKFQKNEEDNIDHHYFFCQVDMKLVSRVLNMARITTDQLLWCRSKLNQIRFVNRKMQVEPSILLFPC